MVSHCLQADRDLYKSSMQAMLRDMRNLTLYQDSVEDIVVDHDAKVVTGVVTGNGTVINAKKARTGRGARQHSHTVKHTTH